LTRLFGLDALILFDLPNPVLSRLMLTMPFAIAETAALSALRSPLQVRDRADQLFELACGDQLQHFRCNLERLPAVIAQLQTTLDQQPEGSVPYSRWHQFNLGGIPRLHQLFDQMAELSPLETVWAKFDLVIISVLLDAHPGYEWEYREAETGLTWSGNAGLAIATYRMFEQGLFSSNAAKPFQVDAVGLQSISRARLEAALQVGPDNPMRGVEARSQLLQQLGRLLYRNPEFFGAEQPRPGYLVNYFLEQARNNQLPASTILKAVLKGFTEIWPSDLQLSAAKLGDVGRHRALAQASRGQGGDFVPFHSLAQWLTYSLVDPLSEVGIQVSSLEELTGLASAHNAAFCLASGLLELRSLEWDIERSTRTALTDRGVGPGYIAPKTLQEEMMVELRGLTIALIDRLSAGIDPGEAHRAVPIGRTMQAIACQQQVATGSGPAPFQHLFGDLGPDATVLF
jgi:hypothetical protein